MVQLNEDGKLLMLCEVPSARSGEDKHRMYLSYFLTPNIANNNGFEPLRHHFFLMILLVFFRPKNEVQGNNKCQEWEVLSGVITKSTGVPPMMGEPADEWGISGEHIDVQGVIYTTVLHEQEGKSALNKLLKKEKRFMSWRKF